jgi:hypothetical protein
MAVAGYAKMLFSASVVPLLAPSMRGMTETAKLAGNAIIHLRVINDGRKMRNSLLFAQVAGLLPKSP